MRGMCKECEYFSVTQASPMGPGATGYCHRYPPQASTISDQWAEVSEVGWCGEFRLREEAQRRSSRYDDEETIPSR
jgi:hypothetical protein